MKVLQRFFTAMLSLVAIYANAQNTFPANGDVGIGTISPDSKLNVIGDLHGSAMIGGNGSYFNVLKIPALNSAPAYFYIDTSIPATDQPAPQIHITGYMYGNSTNKAMKVTLSWYYYQGNFYWSQYQSDIGYLKPSRIRLGKYTKNGAEYIRIEISNNSVYWSNYTISATDRSDFISYYKGWTYTEGEMPVETTSQIITVNQQANVSIDGNVGIGTTTPDTRLTVKGKIHAEEVKVDLNIPGPDYVFEKNYPLKPLKEIENYILENKHLPEISSASQLKQNGVNMGEMQMKLLQKIEELTLYLIEQDKKIEAQQKQIDQLKSEK